MVKTLNGYKFKDTDALRLERGVEVINVYAAGVKVGYVPKEYTVLFTDYNIERMKFKLVDNFNLFSILTNF